MSSILVPHHLMMEQLVKRVLVCREWKKEFWKDPDMLKKVITCNQMWVYHHDLYTKHKSAVWKYADTPPSKKMWQSKNVSKVMVVTIWNYCCVVYQHTIPTGTITTAYYDGILKRLQNHIAKKRPDIAQT